MVRTTLTLRWLPRHVLAIAAVFGLALLGRWQWDVSASQRGSLQNTLYAFQWWAMAAMVCYGWWRLLRDAAHPRAATRAATPDDALATIAEPVLRAATSDVDLFETQLATPDDETAEGETDADLAAYNEYLAWLDRRSQAAH